MSVYLHELDGDIPIGEAWIPREHIEKHIEIIGGSGQGKTTLTETLMLGLLERHEAGLLLIDPKGTSCQRWLGWAAEGRVNRPVWYIDLEEKVLRYNPLGAEKDPTKISRHVEGLWEALCRIRTTGPTTQYRQMQRFVSATLRALIEANLTLADAFWWLTDRKPNGGDGFRNQYLHRIKHPETRAEWVRSPSSNDLKSSMNFFEAFWRDDRIKAMYSGDGWDWQTVYDQQAIVLVNLRPFFNSTDLAKAVGTMFITGLVSHAAALKTGHKLWYVVVEDATEYVPEHVSQLLTMTREFDLYLALIHHQDFDGKLQAAVDKGCRTKFCFGEIPVEHRWKVPGFTALGHRTWVSGPTWLDGYTCLHVFDGRVVQTIKVVPSPDAYANTEEFKSAILAHPWYGETKKEAIGLERPTPRKKPTGPPPQDRR